jgi:ABC-type nitrate/sulfonate/bicarbonate transport system permease component
MKPRSRTGTDLLPAAMGFGALVAALIVQEIAIRLGLINRFTVPLPSEIAPAFARIILEEDGFGRLLTTAGEGLAATLLLAGIGIPSGVVLYRIQLLRRAYETWIAAFASAPLVLMYPLFLVIFGRTATTIVMMGFAAALPPVILKTIEGLSATRRVHVNVGRSFKLSQFQILTKILLPSALPTIFVGLRLGLIFALINIVGVEFLINFGGLGQLINELAERYDLPGTYAAISFVILVSIAFFDVTERIERWLRPGS